MSQTEPNRDPLELALTQWRAAGGGQGPADRLSPGSRARILGHGASTTFRLSPLGWLFFPVTRLALAGALPLAVLSLFVGYFAWHDVPGTPVVARGGASIEASIDGDQVVFVIANGSRVHHVYKSGSPNRFGERPEFTTRDGAFADRLDDGRELVFYRID